MKELKWNVYRFNSNKKAIEHYNVFNHIDVTEEIKDAYKTLSSKEEFIKKVEQICMYYFWCKSEWEVIVTSFPTYITINEFLRLNKELNDIQDKEIDTYIETGKVIRTKSLVTNLEYEKKLDVYSQLKLNWDNFINYLWDNLN